MMPKRNKAVTRAARRFILGSMGIRGSFPSRG
jgi:hypothetical protein